MNKLKEIERLEKGEQRLMLIFGILSPLPAVITLALIPLGIINFTAPLSLLLLIVMGVFFLRKLIKNTKRSEQLRREWLEEVGLPKDANFFYPLYSLAEGESRTFTHQAGDEVIVYRVAKRNEEFIVSSGVVELAEVKPKVAERSFVEESENDELWKLINSNSPTDED